jgi:hypothetical protein
MVLNYIYLEQPFRMVIKPLNCGGFSEIYSANVRFWYMDSSECGAGGQQRPPENPRGLLQKWVAIKKESMEGKGRVGRETKVLQLMKNGMAFFVPQYYIPVNL